MIQNHVFEPGITWSYILVQYDFAGIPEGVWPINKQKKI